MYTGNIKDCIDSGLADVVCEIYNVFVQRTTSIKVSSSWGGDAKAAVFRFSTFANLTKPRKKVSKTRALVKHVIHNGSTIEYSLKT